MTTAKGNLLLTGDCLEVLKTLKDNSVDAVVTDPPYGLGDEPDIVEVMRDWVDHGYHEVKSKKGFMGKTWDAFVPQPVVWREVFRVLKPGGHILVACGTRTQDWMTASLRFAGFEVRDVIAWIYGSGFPKSLDISKAIDKAAGAEREVLKKRTVVRNSTSSETKGGMLAEGVQDFSITAPATDAAKAWDGWGTALKPAMELWTLARKPLSENTVAANVLKWGTGGLNIDGCRVVTEGGCKTEPGTGGVDVGTVNALGGHLNSVRSPQVEGLGRFPANLIHDGSDEVVGLFPDTKSGGGNGNRNGSGPEYGHNTYGNYKPKNTTNGVPPDSGSAARFFYCAKASKSERGEGNIHPTVKPLALMRYLCRLITPEWGTILDPFAGSGTTGAAAIAEDFGVILIEREAEYLPIIEKRLNDAENAA